MIILTTLMLIKLIIVNDNNNDNDGIHSINNTHLHDNHNENIKKQNYYIINMIPHLINGCTQTKFISYTHYSSYQLPCNFISTRTLNTQSLLLCQWKSVVIIILKKW